MDILKKINPPQVKICGITTIEDAECCAALGVNALGFVFFPKSPRNVSTDAAGKIIKSIPEHIQRVGVFVNKDFEEIIHIVQGCGLSSVQLHGRETPDLVNKLRKENLVVIKALFAEASPGLSDIANYNASAYLLECGKGRLPGGNAKTWDWGIAGGISKNHPTILAGGLSPSNITRAFSEGMPDAIDLSSAVEKSPGIKDIPKVKALMETVSHLKPSRELRKIF